MRISKYKKKKRLKEEFPFLYLLPALILLFFVFFYPVVKTFYFSFLRMRGGEDMFIGLRNYQVLLQDDVFFMAIKHNLILFLSVPILIVISLFFSILLYEKVKGWKIYEIVIFLPFILAIPVVGVVFSYILQLNGILNTFLRSVGLGLFTVDWLGNPDWALFSVMGVITWRGMGFGVILFFARLMSINEELLDAAKIDGASWLQVHWNVTIPQMRSVIHFFIVLSFINMLSWVFVYIYIMTSGGPGMSTIVTEYYIYTTAFDYRLFGIASAAASFLLGITIVFIFLSFRIRDGLLGGFEYE